MFERCGDVFRYELVARIKKRRCCCSIVGRAQTAQRIVLQGQRRAAAYSQAPILKIVSERSRTVVDETTARVVFEIFTAEVRFLVELFVLFFDEDCLQSEHA
jgi:hypothetical protein